MLRKGHYENGYAGTKQGGFAGLFDDDRGTHGICRAIPEDVLKEAITLRKQEPSLSMVQGEQKARN